MPPHNIVNRTDLLNIVEDAKYIDEIRFPKRFSNELVQKIVHELEYAAKPDK